MESKHVTCPKAVPFVREFRWGDVWFGCYKPTKKPKFWRLHYLSWPNCITVGVNSNQNRLPLSPLLYSYNRQQLITTRSTRERLQRDHATPEMNCWDDMRRFSVTHKGATGPQTQCNPSSTFNYSWTIPTKANSNSSCHCCDIYYNFVCFFILWQINSLSVMYRLYTFYQMEKKTYRCIKLTKSGVMMYSEAANAKTNIKKTNTTCKQWQN